jgi:8-oxo-dGTP diphosphatase
MKIVHVVAAALVDGDGRVLLAQRPEGKSLAGLWEFPGGKLEPGESPEAALVRELDEELGIVAEELAPFTFVSFGYPDFHLVMLLYWCRRWRGQPHGRDGQALRWSRRWSQQSAPEPAAMVAPV